jgi:hypothetical protein
MTPGCRGAAGALAAGCRAPPPCPRTTRGPARCHVPCPRTPRRGQRRRLLPHLLPS